MTYRAELFVSEEDREREPLATRIAELLFEHGNFVRVDAEGRAVDQDGEFTEGEWDERQGQYYPSDETAKAVQLKPSTEETTNDPKSTEPSTEETTNDPKSTEPSTSDTPKTTRTGARK